jgi:hypothetical protein
MEITQIYSALIGIICILLLLLNFRCYISLLWGIVSRLTTQHLILPRLILRYRYIGPWSRADVLFRLVYAATNVFCIGFQVPDLHAASLRAANLTLINLIPLFAGLHLGFLADFLGIPVRMYGQVHQSAASIASALLIFHVLTILASHDPFSLQLATNTWALVVSYYSLTTFLVTVLTFI